MGDGANARLNGWIRMGMINNTRPRKIPRVSCVLCQKEVHGESGLMQHINSKHGGKYLWSDILQVRYNLMWGHLD